MTFNQWEYNNLLIDLKNREKKEYKKDEKNKIYKVGSICICSWCIPRSDWDFKRNNFIVLMTKILNFLSYFFSICLVISMYIVTWTILKVTVTVIEIFGVFKYVDIIEYILICGWVYGMTFVVSFVYKKWKEDIMIR